MADLVGEAFVRITADTTQMRRAIRRDGERMGEDYINSFTKRVEQISDDKLRRAQTALAEGIADPKGFDRLAKNYASVTAAADDFRKMLVDLNKLKRLNKADLSTYTAAVNKWEKATVKANKAAMDAADLAKVEAENTRIRNKQLSQFFTNQTDSLKRLTAAQRASEKAVRDQERAWASYGKNLLATEDAEKRLATASSLIDRHDSAWVNRFRYMTAGLDRVTERTDRFGIVFGRAFGKGSRNNFLNWTGSMVGGLTRLSIGLITFPVRALAHIGNSFGTAFSAARAAGLGKFASAGRGLLGVFGGKGGLVGLVAGAAIGLFGLAKVLPGVVSLMSMLGGVVSALVGSIGIGLTGAFLSLIPAVGGAVAGLGGLVSVFTQFFQDEKNEKFVERLFKPFKDANKSYYPQVKTFLNNVGRGFDDLIKDIRPSIDTFFSSFQKKINDPTTQKSLGKLSDSFGRIATSFSGAGTSFLSGLIGFFEPVLPYAERLANYVERIFADFDKWANSEPGQNSIADFMDKAWIAADKVWRILGNIGGILGDIFMGGNETGTDFLDGILSKLQELNTFLDTPRGQKAMEDWFGDVKSIGEDLGALVLDVGDLIKNLNSPGARDNAKQIMDTIRAIGDAAVKVSEVADDIERIIDALTAPIPKGIMAIFGAFGGNGKTTPSGAGGLYPGVSQPSTPNTGANTSGGTAYPNVTVSKESRQAITDLKTLKDQLKEYKLSITVDDTYWRQQKIAIDNFVFRDKTIPVKGNETLWNATKGTVAGYVFDTKTVNITANAAPVKAAVDAVKRWLATLPSSKTIRIAGVNSTGGITMASGGILTGPTWTHPNVLAGEAGREAYVPLDRPLHMIDKSVRAIAAFAQGKLQFASGGIAGSSRTINVHPGAIVVQAPYSNPMLVAESMIDRLVAQS